MKRPIATAFICGFALCFGCRPMTAPMPARLEPESQTKVDDAWEKALAPVDRLDHGLLLDTLVGVGAYQNGVDKLHFRSEKRYSGGLVVMEIHFDRSKPAEDRFEVTVLNKEGNAIRRERYTREEVETTERDLFDKRTAGQAEAPEIAAKRQARWDKIEAIFPVPEEAKK